MINNFLRSLTDAQNQTLYSVFNSLFWIVFSIVLIIYINKSKKLSVVKTIIVLLIPYVVDLIIVAVAGIIKTLSAPYVFIPTYYPVYFVPIMLATSAVIYPVIKTDLLDVMDKFILSFFIARPCHCIACLCYGCCYGADADWGIYSSVEKTTVIPLRLFEIVVVLGLWSINHWLYINKKFKYKGQCAALGTIEFGILIVLFDMFCTTPAKFLIYFSAVGISSFLTIIAGVILCNVLKKRHQQQQNNKP